MKTGLAREFFSGSIASPMSEFVNRQQALLDALATRILMLDGAMGTMIHQEPLSIETDFLGRENCPEVLNLTRPDLIGDIHRAYFEAGADIVETNTFGGMPLLGATIFDLVTAQSSVGRMTLCPPRSSAIATSAGHAVIQARQQIRARNLRGLLHRFESGSVRLWRRSV